MARAENPRPFAEILTDLARRFAPWPEPDDDTRSALDDAIDGTTPPGAIRRKRQ